MLRDCGSGPCAAVTVAESPIWFHSITLLTGVARGAGEAANTSAAVASPRVARATLLRMRIDMRTSLAREHRDQGGGRSWGTCGNSVEARRRAAAIGHWPIRRPPLADRISDLTTRRRRDSR